VKVSSKFHQKFCKNFTFHCFQNSGVNGFDKLLINLCGLKVSKTSVDHKLFKIFNKLKMFLNFGLAFIF